MDPSSSGPRESNVDCERERKREGHISKAVMARVFERRKLLTRWDPAMQSQGGWAVGGLDKVREIIASLKDFGLFAEP